MALIYTTAVKNARLTAVSNAIGTTGVLEIGTAGMAQILTTIQLNNPAASAVNGVLTFNGFPVSDVSADLTGTPSEARIRTATGGTDIITGLTVGTTSEFNVVLDSLTITQGQVVTINSIVIVHA